MKKVLLVRRAELLSDLDGTEHEIDELQDPKADDLDRAVEAGGHGAFSSPGGYRAPRAGGSHAGT